MVDSTQKQSLEEDFGLKQKPYFDSKYGTATFQNSLGRERRNQINKWIEQAAVAQSVLDVGCGPALLYPGAYQNFESYFAMDIVKSNLEEVSENKARVRNIQADLDNFTREYEPPSLIICAGCIEYSKAGVLNVLRLSRILANGGSLILTFPNVLSPYRMWFEYGYRQLVHTIAPSEKRPAHARVMFRLGKVVKLLESEEFEIVDTCRLGLCFVPPPFDNWFPKTAFKVRTWL